MKYILFPATCLFLLLLSSVVFGQKSNTSKTEEAVIKTLHGLCEAYEKKDTDFLLKYMSEDFTLTSSDATITTRDDEIKELKSGKVTYQVFENVDMKVRLYGDETAVVTGKTIVKGEYEKTPIDAEFQFTDTLVRKNGQWQIVSSHASRLKPKT